MKTLIRRLLRMLQEARQREISQRSLAELDAHTLRDIGLHDGGERARIDAARYRVHFGLY
jgi:uncharacterized protein YjiS (DUF1127 family)